MRVEKSDDFVAVVSMTKEEAETLHNALRIAETAVPAQFIAKSSNIDIKYLSGVLAGIAGI